MNNHKIVYSKTITNCLSTGIDYLTGAEVKNIKDQLKIDEGYRDVIYLDSENLKTFGIGHLVTDADPEKNEPISTKVSKARIDQAFTDDVQTAITSLKQVFPSVIGWPSEVKQILVNMIFNLGATRLKKFKKFGEALERKDWDKAADEMVDSKWYGQVGKRSERLVARMRNVAK